MRGIDRNLIKWIAMISMFIDHAGFRLIIGDSGAPVYLRAVTHILGRLAFPLFCFLLVDGFMRTRSKDKFFLRLLIWAIVSEIPYDLMVHGRVFYFNDQNVLWTLLFGFSFMWMADLIKSLDWYKEDKVSKTIGVLMQVIVGIIMVFAARFCKCDYGGAGVVFIILGYIFSDYSKKQPYIGPYKTMLFGYLIGYALLAIRYYSTIYAFPGALLIWQYQGKAGKRMPRWLGYSFYPLHMTVITAFAFVIHLASGGAYGGRFALY